MSPMYNGDVNKPVEKLKICSVTGWGPGTENPFGCIAVAFQIHHQLWEEYKQTVHIFDLNNTQEQIIFFCRKLFMLQDQKKIFKKG